MFGCVIVSYNFLELFSPIQWAFRLLLTKKTPKITIFGVKHKVKIAKTYARFMQYLKKYLEFLHLVKSSEISRTSWIWNIKKNQDLGFVGESRESQTSKFKIFFYFFFVKMLTVPPFLNIFWAYRSQMKDKVEIYTRIVTKLMILPISQGFSFFDFIFSENGK